MSSGPTVLTTESTVECAHSGQLQLPRGTRLTVQGEPVLLAPAAPVPVTGCTTVENSVPTTKCLNVLSFTTGTSARLTVRGVSVLLDTLAGNTDGQPPANGPLPAPEAGQDRLRAAVKP
ncbi:hypothetical protein [Kineosporia babensis]|uniref:Uncharacterized protein n=1 Tax=Kineosporia babensis TaxID=499548 RepID=A0A9X1NLF3_9ACTN|nr:hypothetical protein [Kineosporia babensis]MCD5315944.1 hypothetical protein [Kineosporia babensis]